jgi:vancomycin resistance protein VanW
MTLVSSGTAPTLASALSFEARAALLRLRRAALEFGGRQVARRRKASNLAGAPVIAEARSPLWTNGAGVKDRALTAGKVHNLRLALAGVDGVETPAGEIFSFWKQVGRPSRWRGFASGRELREGCLIASTGGGLCQLSNALYEAAIEAGFEIVERHAHSRIVPGSRAALGRDATVFWNYVDLRFRAKTAFRIEARLTRDALVVTFRAPNVKAPAPAPQTTGAEKTAHDCLTCAQKSCRRENADRAADEAGPAAWLVAACTPEFAALFRRLAQPNDALLTPTRRFAAHRYGWPRGLCAREGSATLATLLRSFELRRAGQGGALQARAMAADARLAAAYPSRLWRLDGRAFVAQNLLPHLWRLGVLQGRSFSVLMDRLPLDILQERLDAAARLYPQSPTLADFRAPEEIVAAEREALTEARELFTAHREIAALHPDKTTLLDWAPAAPMRAKQGGRSLLLPASALARKGAYALREAIEGLDVELLIAGAADESKDFWAGLKARKLARHERPTELAAVVLPAIVEHQPRALIAARAAGIPVIATSACGLEPEPGLTIVPPMETQALRAAIIAALQSGA